MIVAHTADELRDAILQRRIAGDSVGFVPTMGMLHDGQLSLVKRARAENGCVVVSSFINPHAFSSLDEADPGVRDHTRDLALLEHASADICFLPDVSTLYPPDDTTRVTVEGPLTDWPMLPKRQVAERLWDLIGDRFRHARPQPDAATPSDRRRRRQ